MDSAVIIPLDYDNETAVGERLLSLDFREVEHRELPQAWQDQYDLSRPSRAFALEL